MKSRYIAAGIVVFVFVGLGVGILLTRPREASKINIAKEFDQVAGEKSQAVFELPKIKESAVSSQQSAEKSRAEEIPEKAYLNVPFAPQAPYANWKQPYQDACEEAAIIMVHYFSQGKSLSRDQMNTEILKMVAWQNKNWGGHHDLEGAQIADLAKKFYGYKNIKIKYGFSITDLKREIAGGYPVIIPTAGRLLGNPNFRGAGPLYHCLVVKGYKGDLMITNDPGTRNGLDYTYNAATIMKAAHEWNGGNVSTGRSAMIVIKK